LSASTLKLGEDFLYKLLLTVKPWNRVRLENQKVIRCLIKKTLTVWPLISTGGSHCLSFVSDANVVALHRLLWTHQEKIGDYLSSSRDHKAVGRRPFDKMATLLAYLGPPEHKPVDSQYVPK